MEHTEILLPAVVRPEIITAETERTDSKRSPFIEANTIPGTFDEVKQDHIIPVFANNLPLISHADFIDVASTLAANIFNGEEILKPEIRLSHAVMGRVPDAKDKSVQELQPWERTVFYARMAFAIEIPSINSVVDGNILSLTIGGVRNYSEENLYSRSLCDQRFKIFIGFKNTVCCNMCVISDGYMDDLKVKNNGQLKAAFRTLLEGYNKNYHLYHLNKLAEHTITEQQFANLVGRIKMYQHLPSALKADIPPIFFGESQVSCVVKDFYKDESFCRDGNGNINLWKLYNLFTGSNKASYIDSFLDRSVSAFSFIEQIRFALEGRGENWYLG